MDLMRLAQEMNGWSIIAKPALCLNGKTYRPKCKTCGIEFTALQANRRYCDKHSAHRKYTGQDDTHS